MRLRPILLAAAALLLFVAPNASAALPFSFGVQANFADDFDFGIGARAMFDTETVLPSTRAVASFDFYFPDSGFSEVDWTYWEFNVNGHYMFPLENSPVDVYAGAGLHIYNWSVDVPDVTVPGFGTVSGGGDDSGAGLNILGGVEFDAGPTVTPFAELKIELGGAEQFIITGGVLF